MSREGNLWRTALEGFTRVLETCVFFLEWGVSVVHVHSAHEEGFRLSPSGLAGTSPSSPPGQVYTNGKQPTEGELGRRQGKEISHTAQGILFYNSSDAYKGRDTATPPRP